MPAGRLPTGIEAMTELLLMTETVLSSEFVTYTRLGVGNPGVTATPAGEFPTAIFVITEFCCSVNY